MVDAEAALDLAEVKKGETVIDLGSGDGRLLIAAAKRGANAIGYEINPIMFLISWARCWPYRKQIKIHLRDYWVVKLPRAEVIYTFLVRQHTARLDRKLMQDVSEPTRVVSYVFGLPRDPVRQTHNTYLYRYP
jgi:16S rRNA A1518/A1519 N6-dimethyltransferase RsmA/KsgA/DIM1 with predicted DNA glycosylase/AP lyase activity